MELLAPLTKATHRERVLAVLYFAREYEGLPGLTVPEIRERLTQARVKNARRLNVSNVLSRAGPAVDTMPANGGAAGRLWSLTDTGARDVEDVLGLAHHLQTHHDVRSLRQLAAGVPDEVIRGYIEEAVQCLEVGALRASVVFLWTAAIRSLQEEALGSFRAKDVSAALQTHDPKARDVKKVEDFSNVKDSVALLAFRTLGLVDKGQWQTLDDALGLRNRCGHPTKYRPGVNRASAFIEDVVGIVFS